MITPTTAVDLRRPSHLTVRDDERAVEEAARVEIVEQG